MQGLTIIIETTITRLFAMVVPSVHIIKLFKYVCLQALIVITSGKIQRVQKVYMIGMASLCSA